MTPTDLALNAIVSFIAGDRRKQTICGRIYKITTEGHYMVEVISHPSAPIRRDAHGRYPLGLEVGMRRYRMTADLLTVIS